MDQNKSWRDELVDSRTAAFAFLKEHLKDRGLPSFVVEDDAVESSWLVRSMPVVRLEEDGREVLHINMDLPGPDRKQCHVGELYVAPEFRKRGLGHLAVKFIIGLAYEANAPIDFSYMEECVADFMPGFGCAPSYAPTFEGDMNGVREQFKKSNRKLTDSDNMIFDAMRRNARHDVRQAWQNLAQAVLSEEGREARRAIFWNTSYDYPLTLTPSEPRTLAILQLRLGVLPFVEEKPYCAEPIIVLPSPEPERSPVPIWMPQPVAAARELALP